MNKKVTIIHFSPGGTTKQVAEIFAQGLPQKEFETVDLLKAPPAEESSFNENELVVIAMPVFSGRIPCVCADMLKKFTGNNTPAVLLAAYGNREFEDALVEMQDIIIARGFNVIGAAAVIARHSIFPTVANGRPDNDDTSVIMDFAGKCAEKAENPSSPLLVLPGNRPYRKYSTPDMKPTGIKEDCANCGICAELCPTGAISTESPTETDSIKCITCMACVYNCPAHTRSLHSPAFETARANFEKNFSAPKEIFAAI